MNIESDTRERVIRLEEKVTGVRRELDEISSKLDEVVEMLHRVRGIGWFGLTLLTVAGSAGTVLGWFVKGALGRL